MMTRAFEPEEVGRMAQVLATAEAVSAEAVEYRPAAHALTHAAAPTPEL